jgi:predicted nucleic acid-binding protein
MKSSSFISDASALIYLAKCDAFSEATAVLGVLGVPPAVWKEAVEAGESRGLPDAAATRLALEKGWLRRLVVTPAQERAGWALGRTHRLGAGESQVLVMARQGAIALMDDDEAAAVARMMGISVMRTPQIPVYGVRRGVFNVERGLNLLDRIAAVTTLPAGLLQQLLAKIEGDRR